MKSKATFQFEVASIILLTSMTLYGDITRDPIADYVKTAKLEKGPVLNLWKIDLNHDGRKEILVEIKPTPEETAEEEKENNWNPQTPYEHGFAVYIPRGADRGYVQSRGTDFGTYFQEGTGLSVDIRRCFVGRISQLEKWGLVTMDLEQEKKGEHLIATVYAYTVEDDHLKVSVLGKFDPTSEKSPIFEQYLSDNKRTKVELEKIAP